MRDMIRLETALDECLARLKHRCQQLHPEIDASVEDDIESIDSSMSISMAGNSSNRAVRFAGQEREVEHMKRKLAKLEQENAVLKRELKQCQSLLGQLDSSLPKCASDEEKKQEDGGRLSLPEGGILTLVRQLNFKDSMPRSKKLE